MAKAAKKAPKRDRDEDVIDAPGMGHNAGINRKALKSVVDRIEVLEEEKRGLSEDIKQIYAEGKSKGLDPAVVRRIVTDRRKEKEKLREFKEKLEQYAFILDPELAEVLS